MSNTRGAVRDYIHPGVEDYFAQPHPGVRDDFAKKIISDT
jgi:hypothetical protein